DRLTTSSTRRPPEAPRRQASNWPTTGIDWRQADIPAQVVVAQEQRRRRADPLSLAGPRAAEEGRCRLIQPSDDCRRCATAGEHKHFEEICHEPSPWSLAIANVHFLG